MGSTSEAHFPSRLLQQKQEEEDRAHDAPHAPPASCQSGRNPSSKPPAAASSTGQPSVRQATVAARDIGGWPAAAEGRLHEGCSVRTGREVGARSKVGDEPGIGMISSSSR